MGWLRGTAKGAQNILYWGSGSPPCWRVMIVLEEKGIAYESKLLSMGDKEHKTAEMLKMNPRGQVPVYKSGDTVLNESLAAMFYLESSNKKQGTTLMPCDSEERAKVLQRTFEASSLIDVTKSSVFYMFKPKDQQDPATLKEKKLEVKKELSFWESYLTEQKSDYIAGKNFSMADCALFPHVAFFVRMGFKLGPPHFTHLGKYYDLLKERPSIKKTWPPHWKTSPNKDFYSDVE